MALVYEDNQTHREEFITEASSEGVAVEWCIVSAILKYNLHDIFLTSRYPMYLREQFLNPILQKSKGDVITVLNIIVKWIQGTTGSSSLTWCKERHLSHCFLNIIIQRANDIYCTNNDINIDDVNVTQDLKSFSPAKEETVYELLIKQYSMAIYIYSGNDSVGYVSVTTKESQQLHKKSDFMMCGKRPEYILKVTEENCKIRSALALEIPTARQILFAVGLDEYRIAEFQNEHCMTTFQYPEQRPSVIATARKIFKTNSDSRSPWWDVYINEIKREPIICFAKSNITVVCNNKFVDLLKVLIHHLVSSAEDCVQTQMYPLPYPYPYSDTLFLVGSGLQMHGVLKRGLNSVTGAIRKLIPGHLSMDFVRQTLYDKYGKSLESVTYAYGSHAERGIWGFAVFQTTNDTENAIKDSVVSTFSIENWTKYDHGLLRSLVGIDQRVFVRISTNKIQIDNHLDCLDRECTGKQYCQTAVTTSIKSLRKKISKMFSFINKDKYHLKIKWNDQTTRSLSAAIIFEDLHSASQGVACLKESHNEGICILDDEYLHTDLKRIKINIPSTIQCQYGFAWKLCKRLDDYAATDEFDYKCTENTDGSVQITALYLSTSAAILSSDRIKKWISDNLKHTNERNKIIISATFKNVDALHNTSKTCVACFHEMGEDSESIILCCRHYYCKTCIFTQIEVAIEQQKFPIKCIIDDIPIAVRDFLDAYRVQCCNELPKKLIMAFVRNFINPNRGRYALCPSEKCDGILFQDLSSDKNKFLCSRCHYKCCSQCLHLHGTLTCEEYAIAIRDIMVWFKECPDTRGQCPVCKMGIQLLGGCDHVTCSMCGTDFCWTCSKKINFFAAQHRCRRRIKTKFV